MVQICQSLLKEPMLEEAIRAGDCLAMLVEYFHGVGRMQEAYVHLKGMESRNIALHPYVDAQILEEVFKAVGETDGGAGGSKNNKRDSGPHSSSSGDRDRGGRDKNQDNNNDDIDSDVEEDVGDSPAPARSKNGNNNTNNNNNKSRAQPSQSNERKAPPVNKKNDSKRGSVSNRRDEEDLDEDVDEVIHSHLSRHRLTSTILFPSILPSQHGFLLWLPFFLLSFLDFFYPFLPSFLPSFLLSFFPYHHTFVIYLNLFHIL